MDPTEEGTTLPGGAAANPPGYSGNAPSGASDWSAAGTARPYPGDPYSAPPVGPAGWAPRRGFLGRVLREATVAWIVAAVLAATVIGLSFGLASSGTGSAATGRTLPAGPGAAGRGFGFGGGGGGFGGGGAGGVFGTVRSLGNSSFTLTEQDGSTVTVDEQSSTVYYSGRTSASSSSVATGDRVIVEGTVSGSKVAATRVTIFPAGGFGGGAP